MTGFKIEIEEPYIEGNEIIFRAISTSQTLYCPHCGSGSFITKEYKMRRIKHTKIDEYQVIILLKQKRFKCKDCQITFNENIDFVTKNSTSTNRLKERIVIECMQNKTFTTVAQDNNVSAVTVANYFDEHTDVKRLRLSSVICVDEFAGKTTRGKFVFIIVDPLSSSIIDILPNRRQDYLYSYFYEIPKEERNIVKYVVTDMNEAYRAVFKSLFPNAIRIVDRFHWIKIVLESLQKVRVYAMKYHKQVAELEKKEKKCTRIELNEHMIYYKLLKTYFKWLNFNKYEGNQEDLLKESRVKREDIYLTFERVIDEMVNYDKDLEEAYSLTQEFLKIASLSHKDEAKNKLKEWIKKVRNSDYLIDPIKKVTYTIESWMEEIVNSYTINPETYGRMTNAQAEAKNNVSETVIKQAYGIPTFEVLRAKILLSERKRKE